jgi:hypothetical protein
LVYSLIVSLLSLRMLVYGSTKAARLRNTTLRSDENSKGRIYYIEGSREKTVAYQQCPRHPKIHSIHQGLADPVDGTGSESRDEKVSVEWTLASCQSLPRILRSCCI